MGNKASKSGKENDAEEAKIISHSHNDKSSPQQEVNPNDLHWTIDYHVGPRHQFKVYLIFMVYHAMSLFGVTVLHFEKPCIQLFRVKW